MVRPHGKFGHMKNDIDHRRRAIQKKIMATGKNVLRREIDHEVKLIVSVCYAEGIDNSSQSTVSKDDRVYKVMCWVEPGKEEESCLVYGKPNPRWNEKLDVRFNSSFLGRGSLHVEVLRKCGEFEAGTSEGIASVSRVRIPLPKEMHQKKGGCFGLVKNEGATVKSEGHIILSMKFNELIRL